MAYEFSNNASSVLLASITAVATTILIEGADAGLFPSPTGGDRAMITLEDRAGGKLEICELLARNGNSLTISRGKEGTTAQAFTVFQTVVAHRVTAGVMTYLVEEIGDFNKRYLGSSATPPTVDRDGADLQIGALYFDLVDDQMYVYGSVGWQQFGSGGYDGDFSLPPGGASGQVLGLDDALDVVWMVPIDTTARTSAGAALTAANARVLKVGDTMTGPLAIDSGTAGQILLNVDGLIKAVEQYLLGNDNTGFSFVEGLAGTSDDKVRARLNSTYFADLTIDGWNFYSGAARAARVTNPTAASTQALLEYAAASTVTAPKAGAEDDDFVIILANTGSLVVRNADGDVMFSLTPDGLGYQSGAQTLVASTTELLVHGLGRAPTDVRVRAKLKTGQTDAGYADTDGFLEIPSNADNGSRGFQVYYDAVNVRIAVGVEGPRIVTKTFGDAVLDWTKWDFYVAAV